ncbi:MAG: DUF58 domain-containing protein [Georgenia sp.]
MIRPRLTARGWGFLGVGAGVALLAVLLGFPDLTRVGVLLAGLPILARLLGLRGVPRLALTRTVTPARLAPGDDAVVRLVVRNVGRRATPAYLAEERVMGGAGARLFVPPLGVGAAHTVSYRLHGATRGVYAAGPLTLEVPDLFGLTSGRHELPGAAEIIVLPRVEPLGGAGLRRVGDIGERPVPHTVASHGEEDVSTRQYRHGDDLRRVHWPATAHRAQLMVRQEEQPARRRAALVLDARRGVHAGEGEDSSFEWAVSALASAATHLAARGYAFSLATAETVRSGLAERTLDLDHVLLQLALAEPVLDDLDHQLRAARGSHAGVVVAAVTEYDELTLRRVAAVRPTGALGVLLLLDAGTFVPSAVPASPDADAEPVGRHRMDVLAGRANTRATRADTLAGQVAAVGWRTAVVRGGEDVRGPWTRATAKGVGGPGAGAGAGAGAGTGAGAGAAAAGGPGARLGTGAGPASGRWT